MSRFYDMCPVLAPGCRDAQVLFVVSRGLDILHATKRYPSTWCFCILDCAIFIELLIKSVSLWAFIIHKL